MVFSVVTDSHRLDSLQNILGNEPCQMNRTRLLWSNLDIPYFKRSVYHFFHNSNFWVPPHYPVHCNMGVAWQHSTAETHLAQETGLLDFFELLWMIQHIITHCSSSSPCLSGPPISDAQRSGKDSFSPRIFQTPSFRVHSQ